ncbi:MAG: TetR family transcriptional regulator C-terminal domain-containing protein, partial [Ruminococcus sp.]|nr:TetR family transcriptional regulator C-terminal domain-containing protein [Ruminococcus sp.]
EICNEASVHRATFYKHFVDKYDFLNACFQLKLSELIFEKPESNYTPESMKRSCMKMIEMVLNFVEINRQILIFVNNNKYSIAFNSALTDAIAEFIIERIATKTELNQKLGYHTEMLANYYAGAILGLIKWWITKDNPCTVQELLDFAEFKIDELCTYFNRIVI